MVTSWMGNFVIVWIMLYMLAISWKLHQMAVGDSNEVNVEQPPNSGHKPSRGYMEIIGVLLLVFSPFLFSWIPFTMDMYGLSGLWCWIRTVEKNGCNDGRFAHKSLALIVSTVYGPLVLITVFGFIYVVIIILLLCRSTRSLHGGNRDRYNRGIKNVGVVLAYPVIYCLFCFFADKSHLFFNPFRRTQSQLYIVDNSCPG